MDITLFICKQLILTIRTNRHWLYILINTLKNGYGTLCSVYLKFVTSFKLFTITN